MFSQQDYIAAREQLGFATIIKTSNQLFQSARHQKSLIRASHYRQALEEPQHIISRLEHRPDCGRGPKGLKGPKAPLCSTLRSFTGEVKWTANEK